MNNLMSIKHLFSFLAVVGLLVSSFSLTCRADSSLETLQQTSKVVSGQVNEGMVTAYSMVTRDGRRMVSYKGADGEDVFELVPISELPEGLPQVRPWKIYSIKSAHTDIGLHNSQYIQRHGCVKHISDAAAIVDADTLGDDDPSAYRFIMEGYWFWHNYPQDMGQTEAGRVVSNYFKRGRFDVGATCAGNHTHVYGYEELCRSIYTKKYLEDNWGIKSKTMMMIDNPGMSWSIVAPYADAGIKNIVFAPNQWNPFPSTIWPCDKTMRRYTLNPDAGGGGNRIDVRYASSLPMVFFWESPDASAKLLVWASTQYASGMDIFGLNISGPIKSLDDVIQKTAVGLKTLEERYPYDIWLAANYDDDEPANRQLADFFKEWNDVWETPTFCTLGSLEEPFDYLREHYGNDIPTLRGEITSGWLQHPVCTPELLATKFSADRLLAEAEALTSVAAAKGRESYPHDDFKRAWWYLIMNDEHSYGVSGYSGRRVFETWLQHRDWIGKARSTADTLLDKALEKLGVVKPEGPEVIPANGKTVENRFYRITVTREGIITSIYDKELDRELINGEANKLLYTQDNHQTWCNPALLGAEIVQTVSLAKNEKLIYLDNVLKHPTDLYNNHRYYRYGYYQFPFAVDSARFYAQLNGPVMEPYKDLTGHSTDAYVGAREWSSVENGEFGVALIQWDSSLMEFGEIHPDKTCYSFGKLPEGKSALYSYLFTDWLQMHNPDYENVNLRFRYAITSYANTWRDAHIPTIARNLTDPYSSLLQKYISADAPNVQVVTVKAAEDGRGYIVRLKETEGRSVITSIKRDFLKRKKMIRTDILENDIEVIRNGKIAVKPYEYVTVRIAPEMKVEFSEPTSDGYEYTGLITRPCATHGEADGQLYLEWGANMDKDFDHYELYRSTEPGFQCTQETFVCNVRNEVYDGIPYRVARYEDTGLDSHRRYYYRIRPVRKDGVKGDYSEEFSAITRLMLPNNISH